MRIAFFGSSLVSAYRNGAAIYYRGIVRSLNALGHDITFYEPDAFERQQHRDISDPSWARVVVYPSAGIEGVTKALESARGADLIVKASGVGVFDDLLEREALNSKRSGALAVFWDVDAPATLERIQKDAHDASRELIPRYDMILTSGGGDPVVQAYKALGARECVPIYNALDPSTHFPVPPESRFRCDLAFVGNRLNDREARVEEFFFRAAAALPHRDFLIAGNGWTDRALPRNVRDIGHLFTADHNAFNSTPKAVLNVNRESMARFGFSPPTRMFEAAGAGACLITDAWNGIEKFFEPGREILVASSAEEIVGQLRAVGPQQARSIGQAMRQRALREHTYALRAAEADGVLQRALKANVSEPVAVSL